MSKSLKNILIFIGLLILSVGICMQGELNPFSQTVPTTDSDVYIYISELLHTGKTVYSDIFDHKGPIFHLIEYVGVSIPLNNYLGLWIIEIIFMIITLTFLFKTANLICKNKLISFLVIVLSIMPFTKFFINGNYPEEYCLSFISISLYYMAGYLLGIHKLDKKNSIIIGICASIVFFIKLNLISVWIVFGIAILIKMIKEKNIESLKQTILYILLGVLLVLIPTLFVLILQGNFIDFFKDYIIFNYKYSGVKSGIKNNVLSIFATKTFYVCIVACILDFLFKVKTKKDKNILTLTSFMYLVITMLIIIIPRNDFYHYGMVLIPSYVIPISLLLTDVINILYKEKNYFRISLIAIIFIIFSILLVTEEIGNYSKNLSLVLGKEYEYRKNPVTNYIKRNTSKDDDMLVLGNECNMYLMAGRISNCKYIYQVPIVRVDKNIMYKTIEEIKEKHPKIIVLCKTRFVEVKDIFYDYLDDYGTYHLSFKYSNYEVYTLK